MNDEWRMVPLTAILAIAGVLSLALALGHNGFMVAVGIGAIASVATALPIYVLARVQNGKEGRD